MRGSCFYPGHFAAHRDTRGSGSGAEDLKWRLSETLKEGGRGTSGVRHRAQGILVAVEMSLALVLLIGAGLMIRSLSALWNVDRAFGLIMC